MRVNIAKLLEKILARNGQTIGPLAQRCGIYSATLWAAAHKNKDLKLSTLTKLKQGTGISWQEIAKFIEESIE